MKKRVVVGMSGGVDSSVAALLLKREGYDVIGVTMQIWQSEEQALMENEGGCCGLSAVEDARRVASYLDIPYYVMNFRDIFKDTVIDPFICEYRNGRTPNPCILCNRYVKWEALLNRSLEIGADYIATGHYAKINKVNGRFCISSSVTSRKDQSYALYNLTQHQLEHTLMPVGDYTKEEIRAIAQEAGIPVAHKPDSQEICFVPDGDYAGYIRENSDYMDQPGDFVDMAGNVLGRHKGIINYTVGQRKGLGIAFGHPMFVVNVDKEKNQVILGEGPEVFSDTLIADNVNYMGAESFCDGQRVMAKIRYSHAGAPAEVYNEGERIKLVFDEPQRAITPGQAVVIYDFSGNVLGGGTILSDKRFIKNL